MVFSAATVTAGVSASMRVPTAAETLAAAEAFRRMTATAAVEMA